MRSPSLLLALLSAASLLHAADYEPRIFKAPDGRSLPYRLLAPEKPEPGVKYPLVVLLHGAGERGTDNAAQTKWGAPLFTKPEVQAKYPAYVFVPQCPKDETWSAVKQWTAAEPFTVEPKPAMKLALEAMDSLEKEFPIDRDRLYVTGLSMGGYGTWDLLNRIPERIAAAAPVCGGADSSHLAVAKGVAVWAFHGMEDSVVPVDRSREAVAALKAAGGAPLYSEYPYVKHDSWKLAYDEPNLLPWLFAQRRGQIVAWDKVASPFDQPPSNLMPGAGTMQSGLWFRALWRNRREQWSKETAQDQNAVVFFGDSITQGWSSLAKDFPSLKVANRGISGDTTRGLRGRVQGDVIALHPKAVSILIGTNDLDQGTTPQVVAENLKAIVVDLLKSNPKLPIVINKVMPRGARPGKFPEQIRALNALYEQAFAGNPQITFCDTWALFDAGNGQCDKALFPDMLHPNAAGYAKWTAELRPILDRVAK